MTHYTATICFADGFDFKGTGATQHQAIMQAFGDALQALKGDVYSLPIVVANTHGIVDIKKSVSDYLTSI